MKRTIVYGTIVSLLVLGVDAGLPVLGAQENDKSSKGKKILKTTVDEKGFQRDLTEVDLIYQTARQYMSAGLYDKAVLELEKVVSADSTRIDAWQDMASSFNKIKQYDKAAIALAHAHNQRPDDVYILSSMGYAQVNANMLDEAVDTYRSMLSLDSLSYDANVHLAFINQKMGDKIHAASFYEKALLGKQDDIQTMGSLAKLYTDLGKKDEAVAMYEKAVATAPDNQILKMRLGAAYISLQKFEKAADIFDELSQSSPDNATYQINLGISLGQIKQTKRAIAALEKALEIKPDAAIGYQHLANLYNDNKQYSKAIESAKKGVGLSQKNAALYCSWGKSLEKLKRFDEAIAKFQKAVGDPQWGSYAKKQIIRQKQLKVREQKIREKAME